MQYEHLQELQEKKNMKNMKNGNPHGVALWPVYCSQAESFMSFLPCFLPFFFFLSMTILA